MRMRGLVGLGALVVVAACSDSVGPPGEARDLEFVAPGSGQPSVVTEAGQLPLISRKYVAGSWEEFTYTVAYGMFGGGSGYSMLPHVRILDGEGRVALDRDGVGMSEDAPIYWYMRPTGIESFTVGFSCGGLAEATVRFEARYGVVGLVTILRTQQLEYARTQQQMCSPAAPTAPPTDGGGSGGSGGRITITICSYEAWLAPDGTVIAIVELGCTRTEGGTLAA